MKEAIRLLDDVATTHENQSFPQFFDRRTDRSNLVRERHQTIDGRKVVSRHDVPLARILEELVGKANDHARWMPGEALPESFETLAQLTSFLREAVELSSGFGVLPDHRPGITSHRLTRYLRGACGSNVSRAGADVFR